MLCMKIDGRNFEDPGLNARKAMTIRVLGIDFTTTKGVGLHTTADTRVKEAKTRAKRIACLAFLGYKTMVTTCTSLVMAKASWGWWRAKPTQQMVHSMDSVIRKTLGLANRTSNMLLHRLLRGHHLDLDFVAGTSAMAYLMAAGRTRVQIPVPRRSALRITATTGWTTRVKRWHEQWGGFCAGNTFRLGSTNWTATTWKGVRNRVLHDYRENWRREIWSTFNEKTHVHRKKDRAVRRGLLRLAAQRLRRHHDGRKEANVWFDTQHRCHGEMGAAYCDLR